VCKHPNIISVTKREQQFSDYFIMEMQLGYQTLNDYVINHGGVLSEETAATIIRGVFSALAYLHSEVNIIHRDLKPANIVLMTPDTVTDSSQVVLIDFGLAVKASKYDLLDYAQCGTILYEPPEQIRKKFAYSKVSHNYV
jgi:serine/threonine protein kinase